MAFRIQHPELTPASILTVLSKASDDFHGRYEIVQEIGKGGFSTVYQCRNKQTGVDYAVKVIDLRPLRLRERFNPTRLRREVDIMRRLHHPNIIQFVEVYEDVDRLMMVMEYCPGNELFDVILARKFFHEEDAKPIFAQVARALHYLHSLNIIHRDIKPENILILNNPDPTSGQLVAKLLDFGLSKSAAGGSAAKTFVGTPCYLAPEVEYTSRGLGGTYGLPADCWSLGAVLYVMLVARFPEFEQDRTGKIVVKLPPALWNHISNDAKSLIRALMDTDPSTRLSAEEALQHPWLGRYAATFQELNAIAHTNSMFSKALQDEEEHLQKILKQQHNQEQQQLNGIHPPLSPIDEQSQAHMQDSVTADVEPVLTATGAVVYQQAMVIRQQDGNNNGKVPNGGANHLYAKPSTAKLVTHETFRLAPLFNLQQSIASCFEEAHRQYQDFPEAAAKIRSAALLSRQQLIDSKTMLLKVDHTAKEVLKTLPDLQLAIEEEEPELALHFFSMVKGWVGELRQQLTNSQNLNKASMHQIQDAVEQSVGDVRHHHQQQQQQQIMYKAQQQQQQQQLLLEQQRNEQQTQQQVFLYKQNQDNVQLTKRLLESLLNKLQINQVSLHINSPTPASSNASTNLNDANVNVGTSTATGNGANTNNNTNTADTSITLDVNHILELFVNLFTNVDSPNHNNVVHHYDGVHIEGVDSQDRASIHTIDTTSTKAGGITKDEGDAAMDLDHPTTSIDGNTQPQPQTMTVYSSFPHPPVLQLPKDSMTSTLTASNSNSNLQGMQQLPPAPTNYEQSLVTRGNNDMAVVNSANGSPNTTSNAESNGTRSPKPITKLIEALQKLREVDVILDQLNVFWANTEVVLDLLTKKGQHVEQFIGFAKKPKLLARFNERIDEYKTFWEGITLMCNNCLQAIQAASGGGGVVGNASSSGGYSFLDESISSSLGGSNKSTYRTPKKDESLDSIQSPSVMGSSMLDISM